MSIHIERAEAKHVDELTAVAFASKRYWKYPESWIERWSNDLTITPEYISQNEVYLARFNGEPAGFYGLIVDGDSAQLDHLWVDPEFIGCGLGRLLFEHAIETARSRNAILVEIEADPNAEAFYRKVGAVRTGENRYDLDGQLRILPLMKFELS